MSYDSTAGVVVSCKIPILATRVRFPGGANFFSPLVFQRLRLACTYIRRLSLNWCRRNISKDGFNLKKNELFSVQSLLKVRRQVAGQELSVCSKG